MQVDELVDNFNKLAKILNYPEFKEIPELQIRSLVSKFFNILLCCTVHFIATDCIVTIPNFRWKHLTMLILMSIN